jgi:hypothetical protein
MLLTLLCSLFLAAIGWGLGAHMFNIPSADKETGFKVCRNSYKYNFSVTHAARLYLSANFFTLSLRQSPSSPSESISFAFPAKNTRDGSSIRPWLLSWCSVQCTLSSCSSNARRSTSYGLGLGTRARVLAYTVRFSPMLHMPMPRCPLLPIGLSEYSLFSSSGRCK